MEQQAPAFAPEQIVETAKQLAERAEQLSERLEWIEDAAKAAPLEAERRVIAATLSAIRAEHRGYCVKFSSGGDTYIADYNMDLVEAVTCWRKHKADGMDAWIEA